MLLLFKKGAHDSLQTFFDSRQKMTVKSSQVKHISLKKHVAYLKMIISRQVFLFIVPTLCGQTSALTFRRHCV